MSKPFKLAIATGVILLLTFSSAMSANSGDKLWAKLYDDGTGGLMHEKSAIDAGGNLIQLGWNDSDETLGGRVIKWDTSGNRKWVKSYVSDSSDIEPVDIACDSSSNVYCLYNSFPDEVVESADVYLLKYNASGATLWSRRYPRIATVDRWANALALDGTGGAYICGESNETMFTLKYDNYGNLKWVRSYGDNYASADDIFASADGGVYVGGIMVREATGMDLALLKYDRYGVRKWVRLYDGPAHDNEPDYAKIKGDRLGNIFIAGDSMGSSTNQDIALVKFDRNGTCKWTRRYYVSSTLDEYIGDIAVDNSDCSVYIGGTIETNETISNNIVARYDYYGNRKWSKKYPYAITDFGQTSCVEAINGAVYLVSPLANGFNILKFDKYGTNKWKKIIGATGTLPVAATPIAGKNGDIFLSGYVDGEMGSRLLLARYVR